MDAGKPSRYKPGNGPTSLRPVASAHPTTRIEAPVEDSRIDEYVAAALLGVVQALTEFLPVSSSAHLVLFPAMFGAGPNELAFDVGLHLGTALALLLVFWRDWVSLAKAGIRDFRECGLAFGRWSQASQLGISLVVACVPLAVVGPLVAVGLGEHLRTPLPIAIMLIVFGILLWLADRVTIASRTLSSLRLPHAVVIGTAQVLALVPGVSRSGATLTAARGLGYVRTDAARFSLLLGTPAVFGAAAYSAVDLIRGPAQLALGPAAVGLVTSAIVGVFVVRWLLRFLVRGTFGWFAAYRIALGGGVLLAVALGVLPR